MFLLKIREFIPGCMSNVRQALLTDTGVLKRMVQLEIFIVLIFIFMYFADLETSFVHTEHLFLACSRTLELPLWALYTLLTHNCKIWWKKTSASLRSIAYFRLFEADILVGTAVPVSLCTLYLNIVSAAPGTSIFSCF